MLQQVTAMMVNRLRTVRHQHPETGVAIEPSQTQPPADVVQVR